MKRVLTILAILLLPLSVWAMTPVTDSDLSNVTGQAGVSINQDVALHITMDTMAWGDQDGLGNAGIGTGSNTQSGLNPWANLTSGGFIGIKNFNMEVEIKARTSDTYNGYSMLSYPGARPLTIDVATTGTSGYLSSTSSSYDNGTAVGATTDTAAGTAQEGYGPNITFVRIGLGAMEIDVNAMSFNIGLSARPTSGAPALNEVLGTVSMGAIGIYVNPLSYVDIYNNRGAGTSGVSFTLNMIIDQFNMNYISWGNNPTPGLGFVNVDLADTGSAAYPAGFKWASVTSAGYVGLYNLQVGGPITIIGTVNIDVGTVTAGYYATATAHLTGVDTTLSMVQITFGQGAWGNNGPSVTAGQINWDDLGLKINVPSITAEVRISPSANLSTGNGLCTTTANTLGDIYIGNFNMNIVKGSWVDIFAH